MEPRWFSRVTRSVDMDAEASRLVNGLTIVPILDVLLRRDLLHRLQAARGFACTLDELFGRPEGLRGAQLGALRVLGLQGWLQLSGKGLSTTVSLTALGSAVAEIASRHKETIRLTAASVHFLQHAVRFVGTPSPESDEAADRLVALAEFQADGWRLTFRHDALSRRAAQQLRTYLDGMILCPCLVAMAMPASRRKDGTIFEDSTSLIDIVLQATSLEQTSRLVLALLRVLETSGMLFRRAGVWELTPRGASHIAGVASYGVVVSYLATIADYERLLFGGDTSGRTASDGVDRGMNIWGSGGNRAVRALRAEGFEAIIRPSFEGDLLTSHPAGIADMGCGSGRALFEAAHFVLNHTARGHRLHERPLFLVAADLNEEACSQARATLSNLADHPNVRVAVLRADVGEPEAYDAALRDLQLYDPSLERHVGAADFLHTFMFLLHDRELVLREPTEARDQVRRAALASNPGALEDALARLSLHYRLTEDILDRPEEAFTVDANNDGQLVPSEVIAADLIALMGRWKRFLQHGLLLMEAHVPRLCEVSPDPTSEDDEPVRTDVDPASGVWGVHFASNQYLMPYLEHETALVFAGLIPAYSCRTETGGVSLSHWVPQELGYRDMTAEVIALATLDRALDTVAT